MWKFSEDKPIFLQIVDRLSVSVITGEYPSGERVPSVRELANEAGVNPNTMQRAFAEMESTGLIVTRRGDGRYVTENAEILQNILQSAIKRNTDEYISAMKNLGLDLGCVKKIIAERED